MKTILIPISGRQQARNILRTGAFSRLASSLRVRVIILAPSYKIEEYKKEFGRDQVFFEGIMKQPKNISTLDRFFDRLALFYIDSPTVRFLRKEWLLFERKRPVRYLVSMSFLLLVGNIRLLRKILRFFDYFLVNDNRFEEIFEIHKPDLVFVPRIDLPLDRSILRHAKKREIRTIGMINSWDNITLAKYSFRLLPDKLIVHNEIIKKEACKYLDMSFRNIFISGMPHFDRYVTEKRSSRELFCKKLGIDPKKRIILFASIGSTLNPTEYQVLSMLDQAIIDGRLPKDLNIIFRFHPSGKTLIDEKNYSETIIFDDSKTIIHGEQDYAEILKLDTDHLADSLFHTEMTIATASTMIIDAAAFDKPSINIGFDGYENKQFYKSVKRFYTPSHAHYQPIVKSNGTKIAYSCEELILYINYYLANPAKDREGRKRIVNEQCYTLDGKSGERIAQCILSEL